MNHRRQSADLTEFGGQYEGLGLQQARKSPSVTKEDVTKITLIRQSVLEYTDTATLLWLVAGGG